MRARVLVVDDDPALAEMLGIVLRSEGFLPSFVADGERALAAFRETQARHRAARPDAARHERHRRVPGDPGRVRHADRHADGQERHRRRGARPRVRAPTTTWSSRSSPRSWSPGCGPGCAGARTSRPRCSPSGRAGNQITIDVPAHTVSRARRRGHADPAGVRPAGRAGPQAAPGVHPRGAARAGLGLPARRRHPAGQRARPAAARQDRAGSGAAGDRPDRARRRLQGRHRPSTWAAMPAPPPAPASRSCATRCAVRRRRCVGPASAPAGPGGARCSCAWSPSPWSTSGAAGRHVRLFLSRTRITDGLVQAREASASATATQLTRAPTPVSQQLAA